jgi:hypothetical protein
MGGERIKYRHRDERGQDAQQETYITFEYDTTVVAALAAPRTPNPTRNPNRPTKKTKKKKKKRKP